MIPNLVEFMAHYEVVGALMDRAAGYQTAMFALYAGSDIGASDRDARDLARDGSIRRDLVETNVSTEDQRLFARCAKVVAVDMEQKSLFKNARESMSHRASVELKGLCDSGLVQRLMVQSQFHAESTSCPILGTILEAKDEAGSKDANSHFVGIPPGQNSTSTLSNEIAGRESEVVKTFRFSGTLYVRHTGKQLKVRDLAHRAPEHYGQGVGKFDGANHAEVDTAATVPSRVDMSGGDDLLRSHRVDPPTFTLECLLHGTVHRRRYT